MAATHGKRCPCGSEIEILDEMRDGGKFRIVNGGRERQYQVTRFIEPKSVTILTKGHITLTSCST